MGFGPPVSIPLTMLLPFLLLLLAFSSPASSAATNKSSSGGGRPMSSAARQRLLDVKKSFDTVYTEQLEERQGSAPAFEDYWGWVKEDGLLCWDDTDCQWIDQSLQCQDEDIEVSTAKAHERWKGYLLSDVKGRCDCSDVSYFYPSQLACRFAWWQHLLFVLLALVIAAILIAIVALFLLPLFVVKQGDKAKLLKQSTTTTHDGTKKTEGDEEEEEEGQHEQEEKPLEKSDEQEYPRSYGEAIKNYGKTMGKVPKLARQESKHLSKTFPKT